MTAPVGFMDNCCTCNQPVDITSAGVRSQFNWPGFAPFTSQGPNLDTQGVRYLTLTCQVLNPATGATITRSITSSLLNSTFQDDVTGTVADADGPFLGDFNPSLISSAVWPPDHITDTVATWAAGLTLTLSDPVTLAFCAAKAAALLAAVDLGSLPFGPGGSKLVTYDAKYVDPNRTHLASNDVFINWLRLGVVVGPENPPGSGLAPLMYCWADAVTGGAVTAVIGHPFGTMRPFELVAPAMTVEDDAIFTPGSTNAYDQLAWWQMRKAKSKPTVGLFTGPVCCETDYFYQYAGDAPPSSCAMVPIQGNGELWLDPPALAAATIDNQRIVTVTPWFGKALTDGGCPCQ